MPLPVPVFSYSSTREPLLAPTGYAGAPRKFRLSSHQGIGRWREDKTAQLTWRQLRQRAVIALVLLSVAVLGWSSGRKTALRRHRDKLALREQLLEHARLDDSKLCNPYSQRGVLLVNTTDAASNRWQPFSSSPRCQPLDFLSALNSSTPLVDLEFARNKTILLYGDSIDRGNVQNFCSFIGDGKLELIGYNHTFSPPHPPGHERGPKGFKNMVDGTRNWVDSDAARSYLCTVPRLNLRLLTVFHYGFREEDAWLRGQAHFFPPARIETRFDYVAISILNNMAKAYGISPVPDIVSLTPGFWELWRTVIDQDEAVKKLEKKATDKMKVVNSDAVAKLDVYASMSVKDVDWLEGRMTETVKHIADAWPHQPSAGAVRNPKILWRTLHHVKLHHKVPFTRVQALDQIGRRVVERLIEEGRAAEHGELSWQAFRADSRRMGKGRGESRAEVLKHGLGHRLELNDWGSLMLGQEKHFLDEVHPKALPGSWLFGQMLLTQLRLAGEDRPVL